MRKPNGFGSIKKLSGNRRRPYVFVISEGGRQRAVEYFVSQLDAEIYQADYNRAHQREPPGHEVTFAELYQRWLNRHVADTSPSASAIVGYKNAYNHCTPLHEMPYSKLRYADYQMIIDDMRHRGLSYSSVKKVRSLISLIAQYAAKKVKINQTNASWGMRWIAVGF